MDWLLTLLIALGLWACLIALLRWKLGDRVVFFGPALMLKTARSREYIMRAGRRRFWGRYGDVAIAVTLMGVFLTLAFLLWEATLVTSIPASRAPSPQEALGIPGINPVIPLWYGIAALVVAVALHELSHGLLSAHGGVDIKSLGLLIFIIPIGAFVEPDEEALMKGDRRRRMRVFGAGPFTNILVALITLVLLTSMAGAIEPVADGVLAMSTLPQTGIPEGALITEVGGQEVRSPDDIWNMELPAGQEITVRYYLSGWKEAHVMWGIYVYGVLEGYPAESAGVEAGDVIIEVNGTDVSGYRAFLQALNLTHAGDAVNVTLLRYEDGMWHEVNVTMVLADKYDYYLSLGIDDESVRGKGFMGVSVSVLGVRGVDVEVLKEVYANPLKNGFESAITFITLPFMGLSPVDGGFSGAYITPFASSVFWVLFNLLYWVFWINLMLGLTNSLPAVPLDGGYVFRDFLTALLERIRIPRAEERAVAATRFTSVLVLVLILWQFVGPRVL